MKIKLGVLLLATSLIVAMVPVLESEALLFNTPVDYKFEKGLFNYGARITSFSDYYEMDVLMNYAITDRIRTGLYILDSNYFAGHFHVHLAEWNKIRFGSGVIHLPDTRTIGDTVDGDETPNFSPYIMGQRSFKYIDIHLGVGSNQFVQSGTATSNVSLDGVFGGVAIKLDQITALLEYDGQSLNIGGRMMINPKAYFELYLRDVTSQQDYNDDNHPLLTFGFKVNESLFERPEHKDRKLDDEIQSYKKLETELMALKLELAQTLEVSKTERELLSDALKRLDSNMKEDVRFLYKKDKEEKEMLRRHYLTINQDIGEKVISLYYESFDLYYKKDYYKAIETLQKALILDPYMPQLYSRLGSIYYELGLPKEALESWTRALQLDPNNKDLNALIKRVRK